MEEERLKREEQERELERKRQEELKRRMEEMEQERKRLERLRQEAEERERKRIEELKQARKRRQVQIKFENQLASEKRLGDILFEMILDEERDKVQQTVHIENYRSSSHFMTSSSPAVNSRDSTDESSREYMSDESSCDSMSDSDDDSSLFDDQETCEFLSLGADDGSQSDEINSLVIENIQFLHEHSLSFEQMQFIGRHLLSKYAQMKRFSLLDEGRLLHFFTTCIQSHIAKTECLHFIKTVCKLFQDLSEQGQLADVSSINLFQPAGISSISVFSNNPLSQFFSILLNCGFELGHEESEWMHLCFNALVSSEIQDEKLVHMITDPSLLRQWPLIDKFWLMKECRMKRLSFDNQKTMLHLIQTYGWYRETIKRAMTGNTGLRILRCLDQLIQTEPQKSLTDVLIEIQETKLIDRKTLIEVKQIMTKVHQKILNPENFLVNISYNEFLTPACIDATKNAFTQKTQDLNVNEVASAICSLACAVQKDKGYCPHVTQLVALTILIISDHRSTSRLLEVLTGEGKSCIIAMFAAVLGIQKKSVDIITSSPILASRDAEEWERFYKIFGLTVTHNITDLMEVKAQGKFDADKERQRCYQNTIVYGTVSNFAADVLREEFELKSIRTCRRFDAVIADEVDLLMLDEGVQFTYLSHNAAILHHIEPVLASVWCVVGKHKFTHTSNGEIFLTEQPDIFINTVFRNLNSAEIEMDNPTDILLLAQEAKLVDENIIDQLASATSQNEKHEAMKEIGIEEVVKILDLLKPYKFNIYTMNNDGILEPVVRENVSEAGSENSSPMQETVDYEVDPIRLLVLPNGIACSLTTVDETKRGAEDIVLGNLQFSDSTTSNDSSNKLQLPTYLKKLLTDQIPEYIDSAVKSLQMKENREYTIVYDANGRNGKIIPVDFQNSGIMELNKKWGSGLQQMLEMKHNLSLSSMTVVTNFMSHVELFSRYATIYGLSGTLGLDTGTQLSQRANHDDLDETSATSTDSSATRIVLLKLFKAHVCSIPTNKRRKLYEKQPIIVNGNIEWFNEITQSIREALEVEKWNPGKGRAVLVLCEDIKTATELKEFLLANERKVIELSQLMLNKAKTPNEMSKLKHRITENEKKWIVTLYAHSNSNEIKAIQHTFFSGEIVIATNLAGRGTDIKLDKGVEASGGLFCIVTFLPRNRRVELQGFGRTARKGQPGSVQCILNASSLPMHYQGRNLQSIRSLRDTEEHLRLDSLMKTDIKEVNLRETLFKKHCEFLKQVHRKIEKRDDKKIIVDSFNEEWGQWLQMKRHKIEMFQKEGLMHELVCAHKRWEAYIPSKDTVTVSLPTNNSYHLTKFGNALLRVDDNKKLQIENAYRYFNSSTYKEPRYAAFAYYNGAYCVLKMKNKGYVKEAIEHLENAKKCLDSYILETTCVQQCVELINTITQQTGKEKEENTAVSDDEAVSDFQEQVRTRMQIFSFIKKNISETIEKLQKMNPDKEKILIEPQGIFSLIPNASDSTHQGLYTVWNLGLEVTFTIKIKPKFCFDALMVCILGVFQIVGGVALMVCSVGTAANFGMALLSEGISDCIDGIVGMATGEFSLTEWGISKAVGIAVSLASGGIARLATKGAQGIKVGVTVGKRMKELKAIPKVAKNTSKWGIAAKDSVKEVGKLVGKKVGEEAIMRGVQYAEEKLMEAIYEKIGNACKSEVLPDLRHEFSKARLGSIVDDLYIRKMPKENLDDNVMPSTLRQDAIDFFKSIGYKAVYELCTESSVQQHVTSASLSLFSELKSNEKLASGKKYLKAGKLAIKGLSIGKAMYELKNLSDKFIPQVKTECAKFIKKSNVETKASQSEGQQAQCVIALKKELADLLADEYSKAVVMTLQQNLGAVVNDSLNGTVNRLGRKFLTDHVFHTNDSIKKIKAAQDANFLRYVEVSDSGQKSKDKKSDHHSKNKPTEDDPVKNYVDKIKDDSVPGSILELRILAEKYNQGVTVYQEIKGKQKLDYAIDPPSKGQGGRNIELIHIPPCDQYPNGHYKLRNPHPPNVSSTQDSSSHPTSKLGKTDEGSNCLFRAFVSAQHPDIPAHQLNKRAQDARLEVADIVGKNPHLWKEHVNRRMKIDQLDKTGYFARIGAANEKKNEKTKIIEGCFDEKVNGKELHTRYWQANGVECESIRKYNKSIIMAEGDNRIINHGERLESMVTYMKGLNLEENKGRCMVTDSLTGMVKDLSIDGKPAMKIPLISYHVHPSEAGANSSDKHGNALMTSSKLNQIERHIWSAQVTNNEGKKVTVREWLKEKKEGKKCSDFQMLTEMKTELLATKNFDNFFNEMNANRKAQGRKEYPEDKKKDLKAFLDGIQKAEPRAYRVSDHVYHIIKDGKVKSFKLPTDYDMFIPENSAHVPKAGSEIEGKSVMDGHRFNTPPQHKEKIIDQTKQKEFEKKDSSQKIGSLKDLGLKSSEIIDVGQLYNDKKGKQPRSKQPKPKQPRPKQTISKQPISKQTISKQTISKQPRSSPDGSSNGSSANKIKASQK